MRILALDLSKASAGYAVWEQGSQTVLSGCWELGSAFTSKGQTFRKLYRNLTDLHQIGKISAVFYEKPLNLGPGSGNTNQNVIDLLIGLAMHVESWSDAVGVKIVRDVHQASWRKHFLGSMKRGTKSKDLKDYAMERCQQYGFAPQRHDQAEAIGILSYAAMSLGIKPYWEENEVLRPILGGIQT
jgi:hypothetical protein